MVDLCFKRVEWCPSSVTTNRFTSDNRRFKIRMGRQCQRFAGCWYMEQSCIIQTFEFQGAAGGPTDCEIFSTLLRRKTYSSTIRQRNNCGVHQPARGKQSGAFKFNDHTVDHSSRTQDHPECMTFSWLAQWNCRRPQLADVPLRLASQSDNFQNVRQNVGSSYCGSLCSITQYSRVGLQLTVLGSDDKCSGRFSSTGLGSTQQFCQPPFFLMWKILKKIQDQAAHATVIAPRWPAQGWYRELVRMSVSHPIKIRNSKENCIQMSLTPEPLKNPTWELYAWRVCGKKGCVH